MNKSVRWGAALTVAALASVSLAACGFGGGNAQSTSGGATTLNLLVPSYSDGTQALWEGIIADFEKDNPDINVDLEVQSWDNINDVVRNKVQSNEAPDILNIDAFAGFAGDDLLYKAEDVVSDDVIDDLQDSFVENASIDGTQYGLPLIASARTLFVQQGPPRAGGGPGDPHHLGRAARGEQEDQRPRRRRQSATACRWAARRRRPRPRSGRSVPADRGATSTELTIDTPENPRRPSRS